MASNTRWEPASVKAQLRLTSLRLGQLQEKKDSEGNAMRKDIAALLQQRNVVLARVKAQKLLEEDALGDLLEVLGMCIGLLLEHLDEIGQSPSLRPNIVEAVSTVTLAAPHVNSKDLDSISNLLIQRLGADFVRSAAEKCDTRVIRAISSAPPSAATLDTYLQKIADEFGVKWSPDLQREDILNILYETLEPQAAPIIDLPKLRRLCRYGVPDKPGWLRPRIWKLLFGILPVLKTSWKSEIQKQRSSYYDLIHRLLGLFSDLPTPSTTLIPADAVLLDVSRQLSRVPPNIFNDLTNEPKYAILCPLDENAAADIRIMCSQNLDTRLKILQDHPEASPHPGSPRRQEASAVFLPSEIHKCHGANQKHCSALLRLLYLHASINPGNLSPHIPSLLVPLYSVLNQEAEPDDLAHVEADTFWLFEAIVGEFSELEDEEGGNVWMKKFSERLAWADSDLSKNMQVKGLDPALPHYSYQWLAPILTHTLPLPSVFLIWDALFSCPMRDRDVNPKIDYLVDICTAMLIRTRAALFRLGKNTQGSASLWAEENHTLPPPSPLRAWELGDAFLAGMSLLQLYPLEASGGIDRILQTASDLRYRREEENNAFQGEKLSLGARLKVTMWKGFTNQISSPDISSEESEEEEEEESEKEPAEDASPKDGNNTEPPDKPQPFGLTSRLATSMWRGITNQSSMDVPPSPVLPTPPSLPPSPSPMAEEKVSNQEVAVNPRTPPPSSGLLAYAEKLKDSDTVATIAKVSSNWRAKALLVPWGRSHAQSPGTEPSAPQKATRSGSVSEGYTLKSDEGRRGSLPLIDRGKTYSPPPRPSYFRPPRDSFIAIGNAMVSPPSPELPQHDGGLIEKTRSLQSSLASLTGGKTSQQPPVKSAPRPLLLNSSSPITSPPSRPVSRPGSTPASDRGEWADVMKLKGHSLHRESQSSVSSLSPSDAFRSVKTSRTDWDSDTGGASRFVPLNRRSISPMAPGFIAQKGRPISGSSSAASSDRGLLSPPLSTVSDPQGWSHVSMSDSPPLPSPVVPKSSDAVQSHVEGIIRISDVNGDSHSLATSKKLVRKKSPPSSRYQPNDTSDSSPNLTPSRNPRLRSKRYITRPLDLNIPENQPTVERKFSSPNSLTVEWPTEDQDVINTPRASSFSVDELPPISPISPKPLKRSRKVSTETQERHRKVSTESHEIRMQKTSTGQRTRKTSGDNKEVTRRNRDSSAEEGDDEGYDDLLSAYESESSQTSLR